MSLRGYVKKGKPANWTTTPKAIAQAQRDRLAKLIERNGRQKVGTAAAIGRRVFAKIQADLAEIANSVKPRKRVRPVSKARAKQGRGYAAEKRAFVASERAAGKRCPVTGEPVTECHHRYGRRGRLLMWKPGWLAVSWEGHQFIHDHFACAVKAGWYGPVGTWNDYERAVEHERKLNEK